VGCRRLVVCLSVCLFVVGLFRALYVCLAIVQLDVLLLESTAPVDVLQPSRWLHVLAELPPSC
jgi:hypothetical protein